MQVVEARRDRDGARAPTPVPRRRRRDRPAAGRRCRDDRALCGALRARRRARTARPRRRQPLSLCRKTEFHARLSAYTGARVAFSVRVGRWVGAACWLYAAHELRSPHDTPEWAAWYVARLCEKAGGWTLVACVGASRSEDFRCVAPSRPVTKFPAWCLAARARDKRACLSVRGSTSSEDWGSTPASQRHRYIRSRIREHVWCLRVLL